MRTALALCLPAAFILEAILVAQQVPELLSEDRTHSVLPAQVFEALG